MTKAIIILCLAITTYTYPQIINVPSDQPTIQAGINAAEDGDTVLVAEGTYFENINFMGKAITVASQFLIDEDTSHISATIIDGSQPSNPDSGSVVYFISGEDTTSVLFGFTVTGGTGTYVPAEYLMPELRAGGGIFCRSNARISNNMIVNNDITSSSMIAVGGGIIAGKGTPTDTNYVIIENNYIRNNLVSTQGNYLAGGGGIGFGCKGRITQNDISFNNVIAHNVQGTGGGVSMQFAKSVLFSENIISHNKISAPGNFEWGGHGGGLSTFYGWDLIFKGNKFFSNEVNVAQKSNGAGVLLEHLTGYILFEENEVFDNYYVGNGLCHGGGVSIWKCDPIVRSNEIYNNKGYYGGGFYLGDFGSSPKMINNIIHSNDAYTGGGIYVTNNHSNPCEPLIINNTIYNNNATTVGGLYTKSSITLLMNNIIWGNSSSDGTQIQKVGGTIDVVYSNIQDGFMGEGNIDVNPMFTDTQFHLSDSSKCIGRGRTSYNFAGTILNSPEYDFEGNIRPSFGSRKPDIGAIENLRAYPLLPIIQIPDDFSTIQAGIDAAENGDTVLIAEGTYYENLLIENKSVTIASYFLLNGDTSHITKTIINGSQPLNTDNGSVLKIVNSPGTNMLCGLTIREGYGSKAVFGETIARGGGGILILGSSINILNNKIISNAIEDIFVPDIYHNAQGGGILFDAQGVSGLTLNISKNLIFDNRAKSAMTGGGALAISVPYKDIKFNYTIEKNIIRNNSVLNTDNWKAMGGGIFLSFYLSTNGTQIIRNNIICNNQALCSTVSKHSFGGGLYFIILDTEAGGAIDNDPSPYIYNNLIFGNNSDYLGGGVSIWRANYKVFTPAIPLTSAGRYTPKPSFVNNTIVNNKAKDGAGFYIMNHNPFLMNNILWNEYLESAEWGEIFLGDEPQWTSWVEPNRYGGVEMFYNNIQDGWEAGEGNINYDPMFTDTLFNLSGVSPCVGNGRTSIDLNGTVYNCPSTDYFANPRPHSVDEFIDIGAIESAYPWIDPTGVNQKLDKLPTEFKLYQNYPNPFNPSTTIKYQLPTDAIREPKNSGISNVGSDFSVSKVTLKIYDILGREVTTLVNQKQKPGNYEVTWNPINKPSGVYFYHLKAGKYAETKKMIMLQ